MGLYYRDVLYHGDIRSVCMAGVCIMSDYIPCFDNLPDGHLEARLKELELLIQEDETHLSYLKGMYSQLWTELCKRTLKKRPDE